MASALLFDQVDARPLCAFRALFGAMMTIHVGRLHIHGMYERSILQPQFRFPYEAFGVELALPLPTTAFGGQMHLLLIACSALGMAFGLATRFCAMIFGATYAAFVLSDRTVFNNHYYLYWLIAMLIALIGADRPERSAPRWHRLLMRLQIVIVYAYAGVAKLNSDWMLHAQPMATKLVDEAATLYAPLLRPLLIRPLVHHLISVGGAAFDLSIGPLLLFRRTRPFAMLLTCAFHLTNHFLWSLGEFPLVMLVTDIVFLDELPPSMLWLSKRVVLLRSGGSEPPPPHERSSRWRRVGGALALLVGLTHAFIQLLLPLRTLVLSGIDPLDAVHTKAHTLLSWRMMAVTTRNFINVSLRSDALGASMLMTRTYNRLHLVWSNGSRVLLPLTPRLQPRQAGYMPYTSPMLVAFARDAVRRHGCAGGATALTTFLADGAPSPLSCRVEGDLWSAINGRPLQRYVDPNANLAAVSVEGLARPVWVRPLLYEFGNSTWRRRMAWLRARVAPTGHSVVFFADVSGGVFNESFPAVHPFPARALLVPLHGTIALDAPLPSSAHGARGMATLATLESPRWQDEAMQPRSAPVEVPFGRPHAVRTLSDRSCWAYVFGESPPVVE